MQKKLLFLWLTALGTFILSPCFTLAQASGENTITYSSPYDKFVDITIQSHNGLPRFGDVHYVRGKTPPTNPRAYNELLKMKYLESAYADMDKEIITTYNQSRSGDKQLEHSYIAQSQLRILAGNICTENELKKYFCPEKTTTPCTFTDRYGQRKVLGYWGGDRGNLFAQTRSYTSFVKANLSELQQWSKSMFKDDKEIGYMVGRTYVTESYDFKNKGYWIKAQLGGGSILISDLRFVPYGQKQNNLTRLKFLLPITPDQAKSFGLQHRSPVFIATKVKVYPVKGAQSSSDRVAFAYELLTTTLEVFRNPALTDKIGEIDFESALTKY